MKNINDKIKKNEKEQHISAKFVFPLLFNFSVITDQFFSFLHPYMFSNMKKIKIICLATRKSKERN